MKINKINGFNVLTHNNNSNLCTVQIVVDAGSHNENNENLYGAAHFLEHMAFKGTEFNTYRDVNRITSRLGYINAYTCEDKTVYYISCIKEKVKESINILLEMFFYPRFDEEEFNKEKNVILEEYSARRNDPFGFFWSTLCEKFRNSHWVLGTKESINKMTVNDLKEFRKNNYTKSNTLFSVVGGIDEEEIQKEFKIYFNVVEEMLEKCPNLSIDKILDGDVDLTIDETFKKLYECNMEETKIFHESDQGFLALVAEGMTTKNNYENNYVASVFTNVLGGGMHSLLFDKIREDLGYCYNVGVMYDCFSKDMSNYVIYAQLDKNNILSTVEEINKIIQEIKIKGIDKELLRTSKDNLIYCDTCGFDTSHGISNVIAEYFQIHKLVDLKERVEKIRSVTNEDIIKFAKEWLNDFKIVTMTNEKTKNE